MGKFFNRKLYALILSVFLGFHLCADSFETEGTKEKFKVELTPLGDCIYKIPEVLNKENWVIFLNIVNSDSEKLNLKNIRFDIYSNSKLISAETNYYDKIINPDSNYKLDLIFFRKNINLNCDRMKITVITNFGKKNTKY